MVLLLWRDEAFEEKGKISQIQEVRGEELDSTLLHFVFSSLRKHGQKVRSEPVLNHCRCRFSILVLGRIEVLRHELVGDANIVDARRNRLIIRTSFTWIAFATWVLILLDGDRARIGYHDEISAACEPERIVVKLERAYVGADPRRIAEFFSKEGVWLNLFRIQVFAPDCIDKVEREVISVRLVSVEELNSCDSVDIDVTFEGKLSSDSCELSVEIDALCIGIEVSKWALYRLIVIRLEPEKQDLLGSVDKDQKRR